jgi:hypothetical protein
MALFNGKPNQEIDLDVAEITLSGYEKVMEHASNLGEADEIMNEVHNDLKSYAEKEKFGMWKKSRIASEYERILMYISPGKKKWIKNWAKELRSKL